METGVASAHSARVRSAPEVPAVFLKLGLTCFGGTIAHLGYFRREFVERLRWLDDETFTDLVGLCQGASAPHALRARRYLKNSMPSCRRRFIISQLTSISRTISQIFVGLK
jgi:hypothetical protein